MNQPSSSRKLLAARHPNCKESREDFDFYATDPIAIDGLLQHETFQNNILEPCCGQGHLSKALTSRGYNVESFDIIDRGFGRQQDFLKYYPEHSNFDIITNPPYRTSLDIIQHGLSIMTNPNQKMAMFLRLLYLEGKTRKKFFEQYPPKYVLVSSKRIVTAKDGDFVKWNSSTIAFAWFVWYKGNTDYPVIKWF